MAMVILIHSTNATTTTTMVAMHLAYSCNVSISPEDLLVGKIDPPSSSSKSNVSAPGGVKAGVRRSLLACNDATRPLVFLHSGCVEDASAVQQKCLGSM
jgi:hypothetical protein